MAESLLIARPQELRFRRQVAAAHYALGAQYREIGDTAHALASFERATPLFQAVYDARPGDAQANRDLALCHKRLGAILGEPEPAQALSHLRQAVALDTARLAVSAESPQGRRDLSVSNIELGYALLRIDDAQGGLVAYRRALGLREGLVRDDPKNAMAPHDLASALWSIGVAENAMGNRAMALASFQRAMPLATPPISDRDDLQARIVSGLADAYEGSGRLAEALRMRRQALERHRALLAGQPAMKTLRRAVATDEKALGATLASLAGRETQPATRQSRWREARAAYEEGLQITAGLDSGGQLEPADASLRDDLHQGLVRCAAALAEGPR